MLRRAVRASITDFYFNSWRLAPANLIWGVGLVAILAAAMAFPPALLLVGLLAVPYVGIQRMGSLIARGEPVGFSDFVSGMRRFGAVSVVVGLAVGVVAFVLTTNVFVGFDLGQPLGWFLGVSALYGILGLAMYLVALWPILVDPQRDGASLRRRLALAGLVVVGSPARLFALTVLIGVFLAASTVLFAALVLVSVAFVAIVASRTVLPMVDALEARLPEGRLPG